VLARDRQTPRLPKSAEHEIAVGDVIEEPTSGFCGSVERWENGLVVLEDRHGKRRSFPLGPGFWIDGKPVTLVLPKHTSAVRTTAPKTASGSVAAAPGPAKVARASRIYVEGIHDAELVEKIWGDDLRHVGVVVEPLHGIDDLAGIVTEFAPTRSRRLGVLVDHLVTGSKESRIAEAVTGGRYGENVMITGHPYIDIWEAIKPQRLGMAAWPSVPKGQDWKSGICAALGWPHATAADVGRAWQRILATATSWTHLERPLLTEVERLIDFVTES